MASKRYDTTIDVGSTYVLPLKFKDANGAPLDMSGHTFEMQCRETKESPIVLFEVSSPSSGIDVSDAVNGSIVITVSSAQTGAVTAERGFYDLESTLGSVITREIEGVFKFSAEVTRD